MHRVSVNHKIAWTRWLRANTKGWWRVCFNTDEDDNYFFVEKDDADRFEVHVKEHVEWVNKELYYN